MKTDTEAWGDLPSPLFLNLKIPPSYTDIILHFSNFPSRQRDLGVKSPFTARAWGTRVIDHNSRDTLSVFSAQPVCSAVKLQWQCQSIGSYTAHPDPSYISVSPRCRVKPPYLLSIRSQPSLEKFEKANSPSSIVSQSPLERATGVEGQPSKKGFPLFDIIGGNNSGLVIRGKCSNSTKNP